jgi:hypothetical protein
MFVHLANGQKLNAGIYSEKLKNAMPLQQKP